MLASKVPEIVARSNARRCRLALLAAIVLLGGGLRFYHLDWKVYSEDEVVTSLRSAGHSPADLHAFVDDGREHELSELTRFQGYDPARNAWDTVTSLARDEPQHPPPFFLLERTAAQFFGDSVWARRFLAALFGTAAILAAFSLGARLFGDPRAGLLAAALVATSPYHVVLAQTAREYSLWLLYTCLSSASLLWGLSAPRTRSPWLGYAADLLAGLWIFPLFVVVMLGHAGVVLSEKRRRITYLAFLAAVVYALVFFTPWIAVAAWNHRSVAATQGWLNGHAPLAWLAAKLAFGLGLTFFDFDFVDVRSAPLLVPALACVVAGFVILWRCDRRAFTFIGALLAASLLPAALDLVFHTSRATVPRYFVPSCLALELAAVPTFLAAWRARHKAVRAAAAVALAYVLGTGTASSLIGDQARYWWYASTDASLARIAQTLSPRAHAPIVYADNDFILCTLLAEGVEGSFQIGAPIHPDATGGEALLIGRPKFVNRVVSLTRLKPVPLAVVFPAQSASAIAARLALAHERGGANPFFAQPILWRLR